MRLPITATMLILATVWSVWATPEWEDCTHLFSGKHIQISRTSLDYSEVRDEYYRFLVKNLDDFADSLKRVGKLPRGKVYIGTLDSWWYNSGTGYSVDMHRSKDGYHCWLRDISQDYLTKVIAYFASDNWKSFSYDPSKVDHNRAVEIFNRRIDTITVTYKYPPKEVMGVGNGIVVYFQDDDFICKIGDKVYRNIMGEFPFSIGSTTFIGTRDTVYVVEDGAEIFKIKGRLSKNMPPFFVGSKMFIVLSGDSDETFYVVENGAVINKFKFEDDEIGWANSRSRFYIMNKEIFPEWVNIKNSEGYLLSYSIPKNKFYRLKQENDE